MSQPYMKMYWGDYLRDTGHLNTIQHGAYLLLIAAYWCKGGLPKDEKYIRQIAKLSPQAWDKHRPVLVQFFNIVDGVWTHKRINVELAQAIVKSRAQSANGQRRHAPITRTSTSKEESKTQSPSLTHQDSIPFGNGKSGENPTMAELERDYFRRGRMVLGRSSGGMLSLLLRVKQFDIAGARAVLELAATKFDPKQFVGGVVRNYQQRNGGTNGAQTRGSILDATDRILRVVEGRTDSGGGEKDLLSLPPRPVG